jgi:hypothetical protein
MSVASRLLQPGAMVTTDFSGRITTHKILLRYKGVCQSGILFEVHPPVPKSNNEGIDADWFEPVPESGQGSLL